MTSKKFRVRAGLGLASGAACAALAVFGPLAASSASGSSKAAIQIGSISDESGPTSVTQLPFLHGIETVLDETNAGGGIDGHKINLTREDEKFVVQDGITGYDTLVHQDHVVALVGSLNDSDVQAALLPKLAQDKVPVIGAESTTHAAISPVNPYFFAMECTYEDQAAIAIPWETKEVGVAHPKVAVLALDVASGTEWANDVGAQVKHEGGTYLGSQLLAPTATDADAEIQKVVAEHPTFVAIHGSATTATIVLKSMVKFGLNVPAIGIFATGDTAVYQAVPKAYGNKFHFVNCYTPGDIKEPGTAAMLAAAKKYGYGSDALNVNFTNGYVVGLTFIQGLQDANGNFTSAGITKGMNKVSDFATGGLSPNVEFSPSNHDGVQLVRPYGYDYATGKFVAVGTYDQYSTYLPLAKLTNGS
jgi:branched-chain amino acid transport system substrate-binding protein